MGGVSSPYLVIWSGKDGRCVRQVVLDEEHFPPDARLLKCQYSGGRLLLASYRSSRFYLVLLNVESGAARVLRMFEQDKDNNERHIGEHKDNTERDIGEKDGTGREMSEDKDNTERDIGEKDGTGREMVVMRNGKMSVVDEKVFVEWDVKNGDVVRR